MSDKYIVQWIIHGQHIDADGLSHQRFPGDEDIVMSLAALRMKLSGQAEIIGTKSEVMAGRVIDDVSAGEIMNDLEEGS